MSTNLLLPNLTQRVIQVAAKMKQQRRKIYCIGTQILKPGKAVVALQYLKDFTVRQQKD